VKTIGEVHHGNIAGTAILKACQFQKSHCSEQNTWGSKCVELGSMPYEQFIKKTSISFEIVGFFKP
jgi:hypothetical protein